MAAVRRSSAVTRPPRAPFSARKSSRYACGGAAARALVARASRSARARRGRSSAGYSAQSSLERVAAREQARRASARSRAGALSPRFGASRPCGESSPGSASGSTSRISRPMNWSWRAPRLVLVILRASRDRVAPGAPAAPARAAARGSSVDQRLAQSPAARASRPCAGSWTGASRGLPRRSARRRAFRAGSFASAGMGGRRRRLL